MPYLETCILCKKELLPSVVVRFRFPNFESLDVSFKYLPEKHLFRYERHSCQDGRAFSRFIQHMPKTFTGTQSPLFTTEKYKYRLFQIQVIFECNNKKHIYTKCHSTNIPYFSKNYFIVSSIEDCSKLDYNEELKIKTLTLRKIGKDKCISIHDNIDNIFYSHTYNWDDWDLSEDEEDLKRQIQKMQLLQ